MIPTFSFEITKEPSRRSWDVSCVLPGRAPCSAVTAGLFLLPVLMASFANVSTVELTLNDLWLGKLVSINLLMLTFGP